MLRGGHTPHHAMPHDISRRQFLFAGTALAAGVAMPSRPLRAQPSRLRIGLMLPFTGTYAQLGRDIADAFRLNLAQHGGRLGGREIEYVVVDDQSNPAIGAKLTEQLVRRERIDVLVGTVHSGVAVEMIPVVREAGVVTIIPNAGTDLATGPLCASNIFRTSFSTWQTAYPMGRVMAERRHKRAVFVSWRYRFGEETLAGFKEGYVAAGGQIDREFFLPFPSVEFPAILAEITALQPDAVFAFFAGSGAVKFVKDYAAAGLRGRVPLYGSGFLTDGTLLAQAEAAEGILTTLHYGDGLDTPRDNAFRAGFLRAFGRVPDVYAVQGYDTAQLLSVGLAAVDGDAQARTAMIAAMEQAVIDSPRGRFSMSRNHNPIQDIYLRRVEGGRNRVIGIAATQLADPGRGCPL